MKRQSFGFWDSRSILWKPSNEKYFPGVHLFSAQQIQGIRLNGETMRFSIALLCITQPASQINYPSPFPTLIFFRILNPFCTSDELRGNWCPCKTFRRLKDRSRFPLSLFLVARVIRPRELVTRTDRASNETNCFGEKILRLL